MKSFQLKLRELRKSHKLTQKQLADILETNNSSICDWECGRSQPDLETLVKLAHLFHISLDELLDSNN